MSEPDPKFVREALAAIGAELKDVPPSILEAALPAGAAAHFDDQATLALTYDRELHRSSSRDLDLVIAGAPLFRSILAALGSAGAASAVAFADKPDPGKARDAAKGKLTLRNGTVTASDPRVEPYRGTAALFRLRLEGPEREDGLLGVFVPDAGNAFEIPADAVRRMAADGAPATLPRILPGDRILLRDKATAVAQREGDRRAGLAEAKALPKKSKEETQVRTYFEALGKELKEQKSEGRGEESKKEAAARLKHLDRERDLRLAEVADRHKAHAEVDLVAVLGVEGTAARVAVVFEAGKRRLEREVVWFPPVGAAAAPVCDLCGRGLEGEASICGEPAHDALLCFGCRRYCQVCGVGLCVEHTKACTCGAVACPAHGGACEQCGSFTCQKHAFKCVRCCRTFCGAHTHECSICHLPSCSEHSKRCGSCIVELCGEHQTLCDVTGKIACPQHVKTCGECGEKVLDSAWTDGMCQACRSLAPVAATDPAVQAAIRYLPETSKASWFTAQTKTRVMLVGKTWFKKYRVWLTKDLQPVGALGGTKLFGMKKVK